MKKISMLILSTCFLLKANAQFTQIVDLSTGVNNTTGALLPVNSSTVDDTWTVKFPWTTTYVNAYPATSTSWTTDPHAEWITPFKNGTGAQPGNSGVYTYRMTFTAPACAISKAWLNLNLYGGDNEITGITINSNPTHTLSANFISFGTNSFSVGGEIGPGTNTITVTVRNDLNSLGNTTITGLFIYGNLTIDYTGDPTLVSHFTGPSTICYNDPLTFNCTASTGTANDYVWTVVECNSSGVPVTGATTWWSPFYPGNPGIYTMPTGTDGPAMLCNKYYLVKLALQNTCNPWAESTQIVHVNCLPSVNAGPDDTICSGSCVTIGTGGRTGVGVTYQWDGTGLDPAPTTKQITVCPTTTTTYTLTATNTSTGCTASDVVTIHVAPYIAAYFTGPSSFCYGDALTFNTAGSIGGANDYVWTVVECTSAGVPVSGGLAWWSPFYPGMPGIYTIPTVAAGGPAVQCGKYYEIKLALQNDCNGWAPYTKIIYIGCQPCGGNSLMTNNSIHKDLITDANAVPQLTVYPNPGNGLFNIELNNTDKTIMEVYDMLGNKVKSVEMTGHYTLDLTGYSKGIYVIKMTVSGQQINKKIILE